MRHSSRPKLWGLPVFIFRLCVRGGARQVFGETVLSVYPLRVTMNQRPSNNRVSGVFWSSWPVLHPRRGASHATYTSRVPRHLPRLHFTDGPPQRGRARLYGSTFCTHTTPSTWISASLTGPITVSSTSRRQTSVLTEVVGGTTRPETVVVPLVHPVVWVVTRTPSPRRNVTSRRTISGEVFYTPVWVYRLSVGGNTIISVP